MTIGNRMLNNFIQEYRDHLQDIELMYDYDLTTLSEHDKYVIHQYDVSILDTFISNMNYLDKNIILIKKDILNLFKNIHAKIDNIIEISEGYQKLNSNELIKDTIENFVIVNLKDRELYDEYTQSISLPRLKGIKNIFSNKITRDNIDAIETYKIPNTIDSLVKINIVEPTNTNIKRIIFFNKKGQEISFVSGKTIIDIPKDTYLIDVITDNIDENKNNYTFIDIIEKIYIKNETVTFNDIDFKKKGKYLKLVFDYDIPTACAVTVNCTIRASNFEQTVSYNLGNNNKIYIEAKNSTTDVKDLYGNDINLETVSDADIVMSNPITNETIKYLNNNIFDISKLNSSEFKLTLSLDLFSLYDNTKTPLIKGIYAYVTD